MATGRAISVSAQPPEAENSIVSPNLNTFGLEAATTATSKMTAGNNPARPTRESGENVSDYQRKQKAADIRDKFSDVLNVSKFSNCGSFNVDYSQYKDDINVAASLSKPSCVEFFRKIGASEFILNTLTYGHKSVFLEKVPSYERRNNRSFHEHEEFATKEILDLISKGKAKIVKDRPYFVNPFSVAVQRNKNRLILDCSELNKYIDVPHFKYEDVSDGLNYFTKDCYMFSWDLKNGYHLVKIHEDFQKFLGFKFSHNGKSFYGVYTVGPFGLCDMPYLFTKIFRVLVRHWRSIGLSTIKFLDDGICFVKTKDEGMIASDHIRKDLFCAGAYWSIKKSNWSPSQKCEWLGIVWNSEEGSIAAASHRVEKIRKTSNELLSNKSCHVKSLASFAGQINSLSVVVGNCCRLTTRCSQIAVASALSWDSSVTLSDNIGQEIRFWNDNIVNLNKRCFFVEKPPSLINLIESDASATGCGSILNNSEAKAARLFSDQEKSKHSTFRELEAVSHAIKSFLPFISFSKVKLLVDNQAAARIIEVGSMKDDLHIIAMEIFFLCLENGISLECEWIPRTLNEAADSASREAAMVDTDDWKISNEFFKFISNRWGPFSVDYFANDYNKKLDRFYSLFNSPGCEGVDAFSYNWHRESCLLVPPVCVIGRVLRHLRMCKAKGVLVVPCWPSAHYWPMLMDEFNGNILDLIRVKGNVVLRHGMNTNSLLGSSQFMGDVLALQLDCT